ncbi:PAS domain S-box protein [Methanobacterium alcaliphilum]|uniref:PAS domain S-box protein n=1 Tax=Methanobacterium alcaliphilum TaxID=392018 RepID=UPI00200B4C60|nr:PAS domain S-box protein [Methanobacterium alcaliphilum]MCK9150891.1 PAS domain S-box protein [Methanobacterium alcaliphilum]
MRIGMPPINEYYKITLISFLMGACFALTYYFHVILNTEVVFTHFFYIPIILTAIWWKRKAFIFTGVLSVFLILTHLFVSFIIPFEDLIRVFMFFFVTTVVVILSEQMDKSRKILEKSEKKYRSVIESAKEAIITVSKEGHIVSWNRGAEEIFGYNDQEMLNKPITEIMPVSYREKFKTAFKVFKHPSIISKDMDKANALRKNGEEFPFDISVVSWETDGELFFTAIIRDITARKKAEDALIESERKFREIAENIEEVFWITDTITNKMIYVSPAYEKIWGHSREKLYNDPYFWVKSIHPEDIEKIGEDTLSNMNESENQILEGFEYRIIWPDESIRWIWSRSFPIKNDSGEIERVVGVASDITARKAIENQLKDSEEKFREVFNKVNDMMTLIEITNGGVAGKYMEVNEVAIDKLGYSKEEFYQLTPKDIGYSTKSVKDQVNELFKTGSSTFERIYYTKDGKEIPVEINSHIFNFKGKKVALSVARDITERKKAEKALRESEKRYRFISENTADVIWLLDIKSLKFDYVSPSVFNLRGFTYNEVLSQSMEEIMTEESYTDIIHKLTEKIDAFRQGDEFSKITTSRVDQIHKDGSIVHTEVVIKVLTDAEGNPDKVLGVTRDITERIEKEQLLKESEEKYRTLFQLSPDYIALIDLNGNLIEFNDTAQILIDSDKEDVIGKSFLELNIMLPEDIPIYQEKLALLNQNKKVKPYETALIDKNGNKRWVELFNTSLKKNGEVYAILVIANDVTERKLAEDQLKHSLSEKEMLLKEIHHRVKNNLMVISSLLSIQSRYIKDKEALDIFKESQNRAKSMALIHERLYKSTDLKRIDIADYIRTLSSELFHTYVTDPSKIELKMDLEDVMIDINTSIPLGLIINELVTNAMKHAFPGNMQGEINISFHKIHDNLILEVSDNGIGFPGNINYKNTSSLGLQLVTSLSGQIDAEMELTSKDGTKFKITFKEEKYH